ncbi:thioredoxin reductase [Candidatus Woesearchaeota archaeon CG10_big_fil_rev_8_21_14_0_10_34_8]|nr:MAG: thioredoxin reductase [Candidatus Woesearchaeota archaeon CG10_big_fil_rev_8_21_14_0_10_34_8]
MTSKIYDIIIIGTGVTGWGSAMYAGRMQLKTLIIGDKPGGTIMLTDDVENYPGFKKLTGPELAEKIEQHAREYDIDTEESLVTDVKKNKNTYIVKTKNNKEFKTKTVIFATGTKPRKLGVPGEDEYFGKGVHTCALCDGAFYKDKIIGVIGGSDSAAKEALLLTQWAKKVYIIYRKDKIRPEPVNYDRIMKKVKEGKIEIIYKTNVTEIKGDKFLNEIVFDKEYKGSKNFKVDGLFIEIGHIPLSEIAKHLGVKMDEKGYIKINRNAETNVKGLYAAGDVVDTRFKQAIVGVAEGVLAVYSAYVYVNECELCWES